MISVIFIINGRLSNSLQAQEQILEVAGDGIQISTILTRSSLDAIDLAEQAIINGTHYIIAVGGDGDGYGIGLGHLVHAMRRNLNLTYIVMNNGVYGLTTGQASPTADLDLPTKSTPTGVIENAINPMPLAIVSGATFVGRAFSGDTNHMSELVANGITHNGFSMIDVFSPCVTYNKINTYDWYRNKVYKLEDDYDPTNFESAITKSYEYEDRIPTGLIYKAEKPTYEEQDAVLSQLALVKQDAIKLNDQSLDEFR